MSGKPHSKDVVEFLKWARNRLWRTAEAERERDPRAMWWMGYAAAMDAAERWMLRKRTSRGPRASSGQPVSPAPEGRE